VDKNATLGKNAAREFFLWAIFLDRFELAKYLCSKTWVTFRSIYIVNITQMTHLFLYQNQSVAPLIAARIYRHARTMALHSSTKQRYENNAGSVLAYGVLLNIE
jgi:hypothetical protein